MKRNGTSFRRDRGEHGQVLILAVVALVLVVLAVLLLFDIQTVVRGKIKGQNGVDAAALSAAEWQKHSLNLIGELNLVRATSTLISDPFFANGILNDPNSNAPEFFADIPQPITPEELTLFPEKSEFYNPDGTVNVEKLIQEVVRVEKEKRYLDALNTLVSQLQTRISFVGPLIAFGAAQQAAKNNGLSYNDDFSAFCVEYLNIIGDDGVYERITPVFVNDYAWRTPYLLMLESILDYSSYTNPATDKTEGRAYGIAVGTKFKFAGMPNLVSNPPTDIAAYLADKNTYEMIHARNWCALEALLRLDYSGNWWGGFECEFEKNFSNQSEILPLHIEFSHATDVYERANDANAFARFTRNGDKLFSDVFNRENPYEYSVSDDVVKREESEDKKRTYYTFTTISITLDQSLDTYNDGDADRRYDLLPRLSWAVYDSEWYSYGQNKSDWEEYLRGDFKEGMDYYSGARAFFEAEQETRTVSGSGGKGFWKKNWEEGGRYDANAPDIGQVFAAAQTNGEAQRISRALAQTRNDRYINGIRTNAEAKPIGRIRSGDGTYLRPFEAGRMVLPVFTDTALIPIAMEPVDGFSMLDIAWLHYLTEFIPILAESSSLQEAWMRAMQEFPTHMKYYSYYFTALLMLNDPNFRRTGLNWLDTPVEWERDENGESHVRYTRADIECHGAKDGADGGWGIVPGGGVINIKQPKGGPSSLH